MAPLKNARHELFAQEVAKGRSATEAYQVAGYNPSDQNAHRLIKKDQVRIRIDEILTEAAEKTGASIERVMAELIRVGFSDIRNVVEWRGDQVELKEEPEGDVPVVKHLYTNTVRLKSSDEISEDMARAISEVRQGPNGISVKLHDKLNALTMLGKQLGMFKERGNTPEAIEHQSVSERDFALMLYHAVRQAFGDGQRSVASLKIKS